MGYIVQSWDVVGPWIKEAPPIWIRPQRRDNHPSVSLKVANKMGKLVTRGYIMEGVILILTYLFSVPKVTDDIHMVFDATVIRLNNSLWDPNFVLTSMGSFPMVVGLDTHMADLDVG